MSVLELNPLAVKFDRFSARIERKLFKIKLFFSKNKRPSSYPIISGDSFRALADHIHDETGTFNPDDVKKGDIVFVNNPLTKSYLETVHPKIKNQYILIEHNGDNNIDKTVTDLLDDKIYRFYAQDVVEAHEKIIPIPISIENLHIYINGIPRVLNTIRRKIKKNK